MSAILTVIGLLLMLVCLAGIGFGVYMAADAKTRGPGLLFAVWWVPGAAAASGVLMKDVVTFSVGLLCFLVAGALLAYEGGRSSKPPVRWRDDTPGGTPGGGGSPDAEKTTRENRSRGYGKAAS
ncbi:MAG: hypothetical protein ACRDTR_06745 [Rubrobacter sp.]